MHICMLAMQIYACIYKHISSCFFTVVELIGLLKGDLQLDLNTSFDAELKYTFLLSGKAVHTVLRSILKFKLLFWSS